MAKKKKKINKKVLGIKIVIMLLSLFAILNQGLVGMILYNTYYYFVGSLSVIFAILIIAITALSFDKKHMEYFKHKYAISFLLFVISVWMFCSYAYFQNVPDATFANISNVISTQEYLNGGVIGFIVVGALLKLVGNLGVIVIIIGVLIAAILLSFRKITTKYAMALIKKMKLEIKKLFKSDKRKKPKQKPKNKKVEKFNAPEVNYETKIIKPKTDEVKITKEICLEKTDTDIATNEEITIVKDESLNDAQYVLPSMTLLYDKDDNEDINTKLQNEAVENAKNLERTLKDFNITAKIEKISIGPNITRYEVVPAGGVKVSKFSGLSNDLAMSLAAKSIRIEAPIPGKAAVGIEIPNKYSKTIMLKEVLEDSKNDSKNILQVPLGKGITGKNEFLNINKTPHMLIAGATGSGKSVFINTIIVSLLLKAKYDELKLILIDPKKVELAPYNGIPHLLTPVVTDPKRAAVILKKMVAEMEYRYEIFSKTNTRNIESFNEKVEKNTEISYAKLPYIIIIIDELADLMLVASSEVETSIARITQMARAAGIHLIVATQRPSTDVITGLIKSNIPTRVSFSVSSSIDSRTILDKTGAEKLLGKGDMLYSGNGENILSRIQGTYLADEEIEKIVDFIIENNEADDQINEDNMKFEIELDKIDDDSELDELFEDAKKLVIEYQKASTSFLQRELKVGFNRATKIMQQLEDNGIISEAKGTTARKVLVSDIEDDNE